MTKKHFEQLAYRLAMREPVTDESEVWGVWSGCVHAVADVAEVMNPRFNRERFLNACRFDYWKTHKPPRGV
jgi:hypothetical protein